MERKRCIVKLEKDGDYLLALTWRRIISFAHKAIKGKGKPEQARPLTAL
jgi:hypothetical protein